jgi:hypothetical protein
MTPEAVAARRRGAHMDGAQDDADNAPTAQQQSTTAAPGEAMVLRAVRDVARQFQARGDDTDVERLLRAYSLFAPETAMRALAADIGIHGHEAVRQFVGALKEAVVVGTCGDKPVLTDDERRYLARRQGHVEEVRGGAALENRTCNLARAGSFAAYNGFALVALLGKIANYAGMPMAFEVINLSGLMTLMFAEVNGAKLRSRSGGFGGHDSRAWKEYNTCIARLDALAVDESAARGDRMRLQAIAKRRDGLYIELQKICVGLIHREFGHRLGMKGATDHEDVPMLAHSRNPFLRRIHTTLQIHVMPDDLVVGDASAGGESTISTPGSSLESDDSSSDSDSTADPDVERTRSHELRMPDGTLVCTFDAGASSKCLRVTWPGENRSTDLCSEAVQGAHAGDFRKLARHLANAAWWRAMLCDENPFQGFSGVLMAPGTLTPIVQSTLGRGPLGASIDTVQAVGFSHLGLVLTYREQDRLRGKYGGANPAPVVDGDENAAVRDVIDGELKTLAARAEVLAEMKTQLNNGRQFVANSRAGARKARLKVYDAALAQVDAARAQCVRDRKALLAKAREVEDVATAVARNWKDSMQGEICGNPLRFFSRLFSYILPFAIYSNLYIRYVTQPLRPVEVNETSGEAHDLPLGVDWIPFIVASAFYGFVIQQPYQVRNLGIGDNLEYGMHMAGAHVRKGWGALMHALACGRREEVETASWDEETAVDVSDLSLGDH